MDLILSLTKPMFGLNISLKLFLVTPLSKKPNWRVSFGDFLFLIVYYNTL